MPGAWVLKHSSVPQIGGDPQLRCSGAIIVYGELRGASYMFRVQRMMNLH